MDDVVKTLIAEGANQDEESLYAIASAIVNRAIRRKLTPQQVVNQSKVNKKGVRVWQFTGRGRKDFEAFVARQGPEVAARAQRAWDRAQREPLPGIDHYLTTQRLQEVGPEHWANQYGGRQTIGDHVFMDSRQPYTPGPSSRQPDAPAGDPTEQGLRRINQTLVTMELEPLKAQDIEQILAKVEPPSVMKGVHPTLPDEAEAERGVIRATAQQLRGLPRQARASSALMGQG